VKLCQMHNVCVDTAISEGYRSVMALDRKWTNTVDEGRTNAAWDAYDSAIQAEVTGYNFKFQPAASVTGYRTVDWKICKAIVWVESGGPSSSYWKTRVMQIGNSGDSAIDVLRQGKEGSLLVMSPQLAIEVKAGSINDPMLNIRAGIAYLFTRMAITDIQSIVDPKDSRVYSYTVAGGDTLERIAVRVGTTVAVLISMNPGKAQVIHPKDILNYQKASMQRVIVGWLAFTPMNIASRYNGGGDPNYAAKLDYVLGILRSLQRQSKPATIAPVSPLTSDPVTTRPSAR